MTKDDFDIPGERRERNSIWKRWNGRAGGGGGDSEPEVGEGGSDTTIYSRGLR